MGFGALLPDPWTLSWGRIHIVPDLITITLKASSPAGQCPLCQRPSSRVHSRYHCTLADLPWQGTAVRLVLRARRFFCDSAACPRKIFTERLSGVAAAYARRTCRFSRTLEAIGFACGGEGGARLTRRLGMPISPDTVLRQLRRAALPGTGDLRILGVDDWALRRGQRYGTILCDLEQHRPIDLLPDRSADTLSTWLRGRPGIEVISRDRAGYYAQGAARGAPQATQVADRWHLIHNLHDALVRMLDRRHRDLRAAARHVALCRHRSPPMDDRPAPTACRAQALERSPPGRGAIREVRRARRLNRYRQVIELHGQGVSQRAIARRLSMNRETVARFIHAGQFPERAARSYARKTDRFVDYLYCRWRQGCRNAAQLTRELKSRGFAGSYAAVRRCVARWRQTRSVDANNSISVERITLRRPSSKRLAWLMLKDWEELNPDDQVFMKALFLRCGDLKLAARLGREFAEMVRQQRGDDLDTWVARTQNANVPKPLRVFATGLKTDYAAVKAALTMSWSNGQVEGQVNRLKLIKRQMYGRAKFDLLRRRVLHSG